MKRLCIIFNILILGSLTCSEKNALERVYTTAQNAVHVRARKMMNTVTYENGSCEHLKDAATLLLLPDFASQAVLRQQRNNMRLALIKNEEQALERVRQYWGLDKKSWEEGLEENRKEHESNLAQLRSEKNINAPHDQSLPSQWLTPMEHECHRYNFNIHNLGLGITNDQRVLAATVEIAGVIKKSIGFDSSTPISINFNPQYAGHPQDSISQTAAHEFTHAIKGDHLLRQNLRMFPAIKLIENRSKQLLERIEKLEPVSYWQILNPFYPSEERINARQKEIIEIQKETRDLEAFTQNQLKKVELFPSSVEYAALVAAQEKTADTYVMCVDPAVAKTVPEAVKFGGYTGNNNDMYVIHNNWELQQVVESSKPLRKAIGYGDQVCTIL